MGKKFRICRRVLLLSDDYYSAWCGSADSDEIGAADGDGAHGGVVGSGVKREVGGLHGAAALNVDFVEANAVAVVVGAD